MSFDYDDLDEVDITDDRGREARDALEAVLAKAPAKGSRPKARKPPRPTRKPSEPSSLALNIGILATDKMAYLRSIARDRSLKESTVRVAIPLVDLVNNAKGHAFVSYERLGIEAGCGWRTAQRAVTALEDAGYIAVDRIEGQQHHVAMIPAKLTKPAVTSSRPAPRHDRTAKGMSSQASPGMSSQTPLGDVQPGIQFRDSYSEKGIREHAQKVSVQDERASRASAQKSSLKMEWLTFLDTYPNRTGADKWFGLFRTIRKSGVSFATLMAGLEGYVRHLNSGVIDQPMNIARWLHGSRWTDEYAA